MIIEFKNHNEDSLINDCPDIGAYIYIRSTGEPDHLVGWENRYFDTISGQWFEETKCSFTCWKDETYFSEAECLDMDDFNYRHPDIRVKESIPIHYPGKTLDGNCGRMEHMDHTMCSKFIFTMYPL